LFNFGKFVKIRIFWLR